jgi:hypothetical protein
MASNSTAYFNSTTGKASFQNLNITSVGMYLIRFKIWSSNDEFEFMCFSKVITVVDTLSALDYSTDTPPNYVLKFDGDYSEIDVSSVKANLFNFMLNYGVLMAGMNVYSGSVYVSGYSSGISNNITDLLTASGLEIDPRLSFSYISVNDQLFNCTNCVLVSTDDDSDSSENDNNNDNQEINKTVMIFF